MNATTEPIVVNAALSGIGLLTVWSVYTLVGVRDKVNEMYLLLTHEEVGVITRMKTHEHRLGRHSDALRKMGALGSDHDE